MRLITRRMAVTCILLAVSAVLACSESTGPEEGARGLAIEPVPLIVAQGGPVQLTCRYVDAAGNEADPASCTYEIEDPAVGTVNEAGVLTPGSVGRTTITASDGRLQKTAWLDVRPTPVSLVVSPAELTLDQLESGTLVVTALDVTGATFKPIATFTASEPGRVIINPGGVVTSSGPSGSLHVVVSAGEATTQVPVTIKAVPGRVAVQPRVVFLQPGQSREVEVTVLDRIGLPLLDAALAAHSDVPGVTAAGSTITASAEEGRGAVVIASGDVADTIRLTVATPPATTLLSSTVLDADLLDAAQLPGGGVVVAGSQLAMVEPPGSTVRDLGASGGLDRAVAVGPGGDRAYLAWDDGTTQSGIRVVDLSTGEQVGFLETADLGAPLSVAVSAAQDRIYVGMNDGVLVTFDRTSGERVAAVSLHWNLTDIVFHPAMPRLYVRSSLNRGRLFEVDLTSNTVVGYWNTLDTPRDLAISADGAWLYTADEQTGITIYDLSTRQIAVRPTQPARELRVHPSDDGHWLYTSSVLTGEVVIRDAWTLEVVGRITTGGVPGRITSYGSGQYIVLDESGTFHLLGDP